VIVRHGYARTQTTAKQVAPRRVVPPNVIEPLTDRELTILRYLQGSMSKPEIAAMLHVSVNTVKTHVQSIYRKLDTGRRRDAVQRARDLRLL
jgi:LuxR family transcriptional regulator, maltose regulon positive regulatory protein